jgi:hypothetical protein
LISICQHFEKCLVLSVTSICLVSDVCCVARTDFTLSSIDHAKNAPRDVLGTYDDLVSVHTSIGRALSTSEIPMPFSHHSPPMSMATDLRAWADTLDHPYCKRHVPFPLSHTRWGTVATIGAFGVWNKPVNGVCTYISVLRGCQYWKAAR